jgi:hypothetical protein
VESGWEKIQFTGLNKSERMESVFPSHSTKQPFLSFLFFFFPLSLLFFFFFFGITAVWTLEVYVRQLYH